MHLIFQFHKINCTAEDYDLTVEVDRAIIQNTPTSIPFNVETNNLK